MVVDVVIHFPDGVLGAVRVGNANRAVLKFDDHTAIVGRDAGRCRNHRRCRDVSRKRVADGIALSFEGAKIKKLVLDDVSPTGDTELLEFNGSLRRANWIEVVAGVEGIRAAKAISGAVNFVGTGLQADAGDGPWLPAEFRLGIHLGIELLNGVDGYQSCGITQNSSGIGHAEAHESFVIGDTIDNETGVLRTNAVGRLRPRTATRIDRSAGTQGDEILVVASVQREVVDNFVADGAA